MTKPEKIPEAVEKSVHQFFSNRRATCECATEANGWDGRPDCEKCKGVGTVPKPDYSEVVLDQMQNGRRLAAPVEAGWGGDHYFFISGGMYVGVELDGYAHT